jgi:hypothetical protein
MGTRQFQPARYAATRASRARLRPGGKQRWKGSPEERSIILRRAVQARWRKARKSE